MNVILGTPTHTRYDLLAQLIDSAFNGSRIPDRIIVVDNGAKFDTSYRGRREGVETLHPGRNLGCAGGWNAIFSQTETPNDIVILSNDDIVLAADGVEKLVRTLDESHEEIVALGHGWSLFAMRASTWRRVGAFDDRLWPAYFEDNDYDYRLKIAGVRRVLAHASKSHAGSATIKSWSKAEQSAHARQFEGNRGYFVSKWGGVPGSEKRSLPAVNTRGKPMNLEECYVTARSTTSDIHEHLPTLRGLSSRVEHVTEFGVRSGNSTVALLAGQPKTMRSYDITDLGAASRLAPLSGRTDFQFVIGDTRSIEIAETDLLFIDTLHTYDQLRAELQRHASKARRWIALHDTTTFGDRGAIHGSRGLWQAVEELVSEGDWRVLKRYANNNGLTVLERISQSA